MADIRLFHLKNTFLSFLTTSQMYFTIGLLGAVEVSVNNSVHIAGICYCKVDKRFKLYLNEIVFGYDRITQLFVMMHELRHVLQVRNYSDYIAQINWEGAERSDSEKHMIANMGADTALNQDVITLLFEAFKNDTQEYKGKFTSAYDVEVHVNNVIARSRNPKTILGANGKLQGGGCYASDLRAQAEPFGISVADGMDYVYYAHILLQLPSSQGGEGFDEHDFGGTDDSAGAEEAAKQACRKAEDEAQRLSRQAGKEASDCSTTLNGKFETTKRIKAFIKSLKIKVGVASKTTWKTTKTWNKKNRKRSMVPGYNRTREENPGVVLVLDTSGSMYEETMLKALVAVGQELVAQKKLGAAYCCDTVLHPLTVGNFVTVKGGGGTSLDNSHVAKMKEDLGVDRLTVLYVTDEYVDLTEIRRNSDVELVVVNLPKELGGVA